MVDDLRGSRRVSMAMVAARAGVSGQTVSRVVNDSPRVDPETRVRVERAMSELGYRPHRAARALRTGRTHTIGLVVTTLATVGNSRMLQATVEAAEQRGYALTVVTAGSTVADAFERLRDQGVDGAIVLNEASALLAGSPTPTDLPLVVVDAPTALGIRGVHSDHAGGARAATAHLLGLGHRTVFHLGGPLGSFAAAERERGWRQALAAAGVTSPPVVRGDWSADAGFTAGEHLTAATAVFAANDQMALGLLRSLSAQGRRVPEDVSVVGFDDVPEAANFLPPLSTVRQDFAALADEAIAALIDAIDGGSASGSTVVSTDLIDRDSTRRF